MKSIEEYEAAHAACVAELASSGAYANLLVARNYVEKTLGKLWRPVLGIEGGELPKLLGFTPTMSLVVHLFGRAVHRFGFEKSKRYVIDAWMPVREKASTFDEDKRDRIRFPRAISKNNIAKIIGASRSAVDEAIYRLRGKGQKYEYLYENRVAYPLYVETGIMLDMLIHRNLSFSFMLDEYARPKLVAENARINDADTNYKQREWCAHAAERIAVVGNPEPARAVYEDAGAERKGSRL